MIEVVNRESPLSKQHLEKLRIIGTKYMAMLNNMSNSKISDKDFFSHLVKWLCSALVEAYDIGKGEE